MHRFRIMNIYSVSLIGFLVLVIASIAWLRRPPPEAEPVVKTDATQPVAAHQPMSAPASQSQEAKVSIDNFKFDPQVLSVAAGTTVKWTNHDDVPHTATSLDRPAVFDSKALDTDDTYSFTFTSPGTYKYYCKVHTHMTGTVIVK